MQDSVLTVGSRVYVKSYGPIWGQRGTIRAVHPIAVECEQPWSFYLIQLDGTELDEAVWLAQDEVGAVKPSRSQGRVAYQHSVEKLSLT
jgi:hypothetical protein